MRRLPSTADPFFGVIVTFTFPVESGSVSRDSSTADTRFDQVNSLTSSAPLDAASVTSCMPVVPSTRDISIFRPAPARANAVIAFAIDGCVPVMAILPGARLSLSRIVRRNCPIPSEAAPPATASR